MINKITDEHKTEIMENVRDRFPRRAAQGMIITDMLDYLLRNWVPNTIIYRLIREHFPAAKITLNSIATRRSLVRKRNPSIPSSTTAHRAYHRELIHMKQADERREAGEK